MNHRVDVEYTTQIWREGEQYVAHATPLDVTSAGATVEKARLALAEAVELFLSTAVEIGTLEEVLEKAGYRLAADRWVGPDWIAIEKQTDGSVGFAPPC